MAENGNSGESNASLGGAGSAPYRDVNLSFEERAKDLVSRMTLEEKIAQTTHQSEAIPRLGVAKYNWWNECLHGVARAGEATVFPQAIGMAASWNVDLMRRVAVAISDEARAKHHEAVRRGEGDKIYQGLTFWTPNINIFRDPRWGRGQETYGEDPYMTGRLAVAFVKGLQGDDPKYLKLVATPKHYVVHSGPEKDRHSFDAETSPKDLRETYMPAFKECVKEAKAASVMSAYNRTNGEPCTAGPNFLQAILREEWGFDGYIVSDCGAVNDLFDGHNVVKTGPEAFALAFKNGLDLICGRKSHEEHGIEAVRQGLLSEEELDAALVRNFTARFRLGMFDPPELVEYARIPFEVNDCAEHRELALRMARESIVLLKNEGGLLPLSKSLKSVAVIGPNADELDVLLGNYFGMPSKHVTMLEGIRDKIGAKAQVRYAKVGELASPSTDGFGEAVKLAKESDVAVLFLGLSPELEGEEARVSQKLEGTKQDDRELLDLPGSQQHLLEAVHATGTPVVLVLLNGSSLAVNWADQHVPAIVEAWYPGEEGGWSVADALFGDYNPAGRLPVTFVKSLAQLPPFSDYAMKGRTYRYMTEEPLYPFGHGLSYTRFQYGRLHVSSKKIAVGESLGLSVEVSNIGERAGDEVVQLYLSDTSSSVEAPVRQLQGFQRISLAPNESKTVEFRLTPRQMALIDIEGKCILEPGEFTVAVGGRQPGLHPGRTYVGNLLVGSFQVVGEPVELEY